MVGFDTSVVNIPRVTFICKNLKSATTVDKLLEKEVNTQPPFNNFHISLLGIATGKYSGENV